MKLYKFLEYIDNSIEHKIYKFNDNEIKLLTAKAHYMRDGEDKEFVYFKRVVKLASGEYRVITDDIICSTIYSLIKYTKQLYLTALEWFNNLMKNCKCLSIPKGKIWYDDNGGVAYQSTETKTVHFLIKYYKELTDKYKFSYERGEAPLLLTNIFENLYHNKGYFFHLIMVKKSIFIYKNILANYKIK